MKRAQILLFTILFVFASFAQQPQKITLDDILVKGTFRAQTVTGLRSMKDGEHYTTLENNSRIVKYSYKTGNEVAVVFNLKEIRDAPIKSFSDYLFSPRSEERRVGK